MAVLGSKCMTEIRAMSSERQSARDNNRLCNEDTVTVANAQRRVFAWSRQPVLVEFKKFTSNLNS